MEKGQTWQRCEYKHKVFDSFFFRDLKINVILDTKNADKKSKTLKKKPMHSFIKKQASVLLS